eukprot:gene33132-biopygen21433
MPSVTIGAALAGEDGEDGVTLRQNADFALYHAKETRRGGYVRFKDGLRTSMTRRLQIKRDVDVALTEGRIIPYYQPVLRIDTDEIVGLEALARMRMPDGRVASAVEFQEAMADPKVAHRITGQMLNAVAADMAAWQSAGRCASEQRHGAAKSPCLQPMYLIVKQQPIKPKCLEQPQSQSSKRV